MTEKTQAKSIEVTYGRALALLFSLALVLFCAAPSWAQTAPSAAKSSAKPAGSAPAHHANSNGGNHEGITVHGWWTIVVKNPDGTVAARREFENSLMPYGAELLPALLGRTAVPGAWQMVLFSNQQSVAGPCGTAFDAGLATPSGASLSAFGECYIVETNAYYEGSPTTGNDQGCTALAVYHFPCFTGLSIQVVQTGIVSGPDDVPLYGLQLSASIVLPSNTPAQAAITNVGTSFDFCTSALTGPPSSTVDPQTCATSPTPGQQSYYHDVPGLTVGSDDRFALVTQTPLPSQVSVSAGQTVTVTVTLSFD
jgi:hypothetical protein